MSEVEEMRGKTPDLQNLSPSSIFFRFEYELELKTNNNQIKPFLLKI